MIKINLIADRRAKDKIAIQQQIVMSALIMLVSFVLCGFWWQAKDSQISNTAIKINGAKKELENQKRVRDKVKKMEARERRLEAIIKTIAFLMEVKAGPTIYFDNLNVILPPEIWLTGVADMGGLISVEGYSFSNNAVAKLMKEMEDSTHFNRVELSEITSAKLQKETLKRFKVTSMTAIALIREKERLEKEAAAKKSGKGKKGRR